MANGGGISYIPPEYFGTTGLARAIERASQGLLTASEIERKRKREDQADELTRRASVLQEGQALLSMGAPKELVAARFAEQGLAPEGFKLRETSDEVIDKLTSGALDKVLAQARGEQVELTPLEQALSNRRLTGEAGITPEQATRLGQLGVSGAELDEEIKAGTRDLGKLQLKALDRSETELVNASEQARQFLIDKGRPDLADAGLKGLELYQTETGEIPYQSAQLDYIRQQTAESRARVARMQAEVGELPKPVKDVLDQMTEIAPVFTAANAEGIVQYLTTKQVPPGKDAAWKDVVDQVFARVNKVADLTLRGKILDAVEKGDDVAYQLAQLATLDKIDPGIVDELRDQGLVDRLGEQLLQRIPGFESLSITRGWLGAGVEGAEGAKYRGPADDLLGTYMDMRAKGEVQDLDFINQESVGATARRVLESTEGNAEKAIAEVENVLDREDIADTDRKFYEYVLETLRGGEPALPAAPRDGSSLADLVQQGAGTGQPFASFDELAKRRAGGAAPEASPIRSALTTFMEGGNFTGARVRAMQDIARTAKGAALSADLPKTEAEFLALAQDVYGRRRAALGGESSIAAEGSPQRQEAEAKLRRLDSGYNEMIRELATRTSAPRGSWEQLLQVLDKQIELLGPNDPLTATLTSRREAIKQKLATLRTK